MNTQDYRPSWTWLAYASRQELKEKADQLSRQRGAEVAAEAGVNLERQERPDERSAG